MLYLIQGVHWHQIDIEEFDAILAECENRTPWPDLAGDIVLPDDAIVIRDSRGRVRLPKTAAGRGRLVVSENWYLPQDCCFFGRAAG